MTATVLHVPFYDDLEWATSWPGRRQPEQTPIIRQLAKKLGEPNDSPIGRKQESVAEITRLLTEHAPDDYCEALAERIRWRFEGPRLRLAT